MVYIILRIVFIGKFLSKILLLHSVFFQYVMYSASHTPEFSFKFQEEVVKKETLVENS